MKPANLSALCLILCLSSLPLAAQQANGGTRVALVNVQAVLQQTPGYAAAESLYAKEQEGYRSQFQKLQGSVDSAQAEFEKSSVLLSPTAREAKRKALEQQVRDLDTKANEMRDRLAQRERELLEPLQSQIVAVIDGLRAEGNISLILDVSAAGSGVVSADPALDLTSKVLERLQASAGK